MRFLIEGLLLGFGYVAPIGTQNLFMINTALTQSKSRSYLTALIIMFFDITLAIACFLGVGSLISKFVWLELAVFGIGALIVIWIGFSIFKARDSLDRSTKVDMPILKVIGSACVVTWFNPQAIIDGSLMLGASKVSIPDNLEIYFIAGFCIASALWWLFIATMGSIFNNKITDKILGYLNMICGTIIILYGIKLFISFINLFMSIVN